MNVLPPDLMRAASAALEAEFRLANALAHLGDRGEAREQVLRVLLQKDLPKRIGVGSGHVHGPDGERSHSIDIILYDALNSAVFPIGESIIVPHYSVYGIIEVKTRLDSRGLKEDFEKIDSFKKLYEREKWLEAYGRKLQLRPFELIFGFSTRMRLGRIADRYKRMMLSRMVNIPDGITAIGSGSLIPYFITTDDVHRHVNSEFDLQLYMDQPSFGIKAIAEGPDTLGLWFLRLLHNGMQPHKFSPRLRV